jgi:hypothetical protein
MDTHGHWRRLWRLLTNPGIEVFATIFVVMVATWYLIETNGVADPLPLFGRR